MSQRTYKRKPQSGKFKYVANCINCDCWFDCTRQVTQQRGQSKLLGEDGQYLMFCDECCYSTESKTTEGGTVVRYYNNVSAESAYWDTP